MIFIDNKSGMPIYDQIYTQIKNHIISGEIAEDEPLPSIRALAKDLRISVVTTKRAYEELEREGFIYTQPAKGSFVAPKNIELIKEQNMKKIEEIVAVNIIGLMLQDERISDEEYDYYIDELKDSKIPKSLMAVATAYGRIGNMIEANKYSYKALFVLNGSMDFDLYHNFLALHFKMLYAYNDAEICKERVIGNVVVTLMKNKKHSYNEDEYIAIICLGAIIGSLWQNIFLL